MVSSITAENMNFGPNVNEKVSNYGTKLKNTVTNYGSNLKDSWTNTSANSTVKLNTGRLANTNIGQVMSKKLIDTKTVQTILEKGFGVSVEAGESTLTLSGKKLTSEAAETLLEKLGIKGTFEAVGKNGGKIVLEDTSTSTLKELAGKFGDDGLKLLSEAGVTAEETVARSVVSSASTPFLKTAVQKVAGIFGENAAKVAGECTETALSKVGTLASKGFADIPVIGAVITAAFEVPKIITAFKNGDGLAQIGRSTLSVGGQLGGMSIGATIGQILIPIPIVGGLIGGIVGTIAGDWIAKKVGNGLIGESIEDKKEAQTASTTSTSTTTQTASTSNPVSGYVSDMSFLDPNYYEKYNNTYGQKLYSVG